MSTKYKATKRVAVKRPAKKKPAKRRPAKYGPSFEHRNPVLSKLLDLKYRINEAYRSGKFDDAYNDTQVDKSWVMSLINDVRHNNIIKLSREDGLKCNGLWRQYEIK
jgi:hypothetical protein